MSNIKRLTAETTGKIAAGEIIERPVNVVKELIENALDASATKISIEIADGGKTLIKISDNGLGIISEEIPLAAENFATSKISTIEDIMKIKSLGFRGEALASIRSVSGLTISSRTFSDETGRQIRWKENQVVKDELIARNPGTDVTVTELFYNLPARKKFLSSEPSESRRISGMIQSFSLAFPEVAFSFRSNGNDVLNYPQSTLEERVEIVFGSRVFPNLKYFHREEGRTTIAGYASMPAYTRGNRSMQHIYVNKRAIKDRMIGHALRQAYSSLIPADRFPVVILYLDIPPGEIDVNVHPTKSEIRFQNERDIHRAITGILRESLQGKTISFREKVESVYKTIFPSGRDGKENTGISPREFQMTQSNKDLHGEEISGNRSDWLIKESPDSLFNQDPQSIDLNSSGGLYWQLHQSYIFIQIRGGVVIIDQHAAHERILYDLAKKNFEGGKPVVQSLLFPATLELSHEEYDNFERLEDKLPSIGFEVEPFGARAIIVRGIPAGVKNWNEGKLLQNILGEKGIGRNSADDLIRRFSCHGAIKAGEKLSVQEMESLTDQLFASEFPFTCPHGRPTILRVEMDDLDKRFHRT
ncbi:MAG: DNA mismatch repair endonuclease MutL [Candidatus Krumholzibacteriota bacterium]|nr:DNA mismatch repair endonuclease MutL [Candidatus Krumholzibacteriota bacterium]